MVAVPKRNKRGSGGRRWRAGRCGGTDNQLSQGRDTTGRMSYLTSISVTGVWHNWRTLMSVHVLSEQDNMLGDKRFRQCIDMLVTTKASIVCPYVQYKG